MWSWPLVHEVREIDHCLDIRCTVSLPRCFLPLRPELLHVLIAGYPEAHTLCHNIREELLRLQEIPLQTQQQRQSTVLRIVFALLYLPQKLDQGVRQGVLVHPFEMGDVELLHPAIPEAGDQGQEPPATHSTTV